ncbi:MAG: YciI family protein [Thiolinea sp.]
MPAWEEYKQAAKERGSLALEMFVVESTPAKTPEDVKENLPAHLAYQQTLENAGTLAFAGPLSDDTGELMQGTGLIVYRASSMEEAKQIAEADPMHQAGARTYTLRKWLINEGSFSLNVGLSAKRLTFI